MVYCLAVVLMFVLLCKALANQVCFVNNAVIIYDDQCI